MFFWASVGVPPNDLMGVSPLLALVTIADLDEHGLSNSDWDGLKRGEGGFLSILLKIAAMHSMGVDCCGGSVDLGSGLESGLELVDWPS